MSWGLYHTPGSCPCRGPGLDITAPTCLEQASVDLYSSTFAPAPPTADD